MVASGQLFNGSIMCSFLYENNWLFSCTVSFVKEISVWNQTEKKKLQYTTFTLFLLYKNARYSLFKQKYLFDTYTFTLGFPNRTYICLTFLVSSATHHYYSVLSEWFQSKPYRYSSLQEEGLAQHRTSYVWQDEVYVCCVWTTILCAWPQCVF